MAYTISCANAQEATKVANLLQKKITQTPFTVNDITYEGKTRRKVALRNIRLKQAKPYCGNHPGPRRFNGGRHRRGAWLEGGDWVMFNDFVNNLLDKLNHCGTVRSSTCFVRKKGLRRTNYATRTLKFGHLDWDKR